MESPVPGAGPPPAKARADPRILHFADDLLQEKLKTVQEMTKFELKEQLKPRGLYKATLSEEDMVRGRIFTKL